MVAIKRRVKLCGVLVLMLDSAGRYQVWRGKGCPKGLRQSDSLRRCTRWAREAFEEVERQEGSGTSEEENTSMTVSTNVRLRRKHSSLFDQLAHLRRRVESSVADRQVLGKTKTLKGQQGNEGGWSSVYVAVCPCGHFPRGSGMVPRCE